MHRSVFVASLALALVAARPAHAGPPWVSVELPANPMNATTRNAFLLIHSYHHGTVTQYPVTGRAIGLVDGKRRELTLSFTRTDLPGVMALARSWPSEGSWVLAVNVGGDEGPTALVSIGADGKVKGVEVPMRGTDQPWGRKVTDRDIDRALQQVAGLPVPATRPSAAGLLVALPVVLGAFLLDRKARGSSAL